MLLKVINIISIIIYFCSTAWRYSADLLTRRARSWRIGCVSSWSSWPTYCCMDTGRSWSPSRGMRNTSQWLARRQSDTLRRWGNTSRTGHCSLLHWVRSDRADFSFLPAFLQVSRENWKGSANLSGQGKVRGKYFSEKLGKMKNWCHQMWAFQAKMRQIWFPLGLNPRPCWGSLQRSPRPPSWT